MKRFDFIIDAGTNEFRVIVASNNRPVFSYKATEGSYGMDCFSLEGHNQQEFNAVKKHLDIIAKYHFGRRYLWVDEENG